MNELEKLRRGGDFKKYIWLSDIPDDKFPLFKFSVDMTFFLDIYGLVDSMVSVGYWTVDFKTKGNNIMFYFTDESEAMMCKLAV
jgi:hypothetical protein